MRGTSWKRMQACLDQAGWVSRKGVPGVDDTEPSLEDHVE